MAKQHVLSPLRRRLRIGEPDPATIAERPGSGVLLWMQLPHEQEERPIKVQVRWRLFGLPVGIVAWPPRKGGMKSEFLGRLVVLHPQPSQQIRWHAGLSKGIAVDSVYALLRQVEHTTASYLGNSWLGWPGEMADLNRAVVLAQEANRAALGLRKGAVADYEREQGERFTAFSSLVSKLVRNEDKVSARGMLERAVSALDRRGRVNPGAKALLAQRSARRLTRRARKVPEINARFTKRELVARALISYAEQVVFDPLGSFVHELADELTRGTRFSSEGRSRLVARCETLREECDVIDWRPHRKSAYACAVELMKLEAGLRQDDSKHVLHSCALITQTLAAQLHQRRIGAMVQVFRSGRGQRLTALQIGRFTDRIGVIREATIALGFAPSSPLVGSLDAARTCAVTSDGSVKEQLTRADCEGVADSLKIAFNEL